MQHLLRRLNCSTSPIYSYFETIDSLEDEVIKKFGNLIMQYVMADRTGSPLIDIALGYILFSRNEQTLFRYNFMNRKVMKPISLLIIENNTSRMLKRLEGDPKLTGLRADQIKELDMHTVNQPIYKNL